MHDLKEIELPFEGKKVKVIAAVGIGGVMGIGNTLPWRSREDLRRFARLTMGSAVVMGRKTFESIGKPLRGRMLVVLSRGRQDRLAGCEMRADVHEAMAAAADRPGNTVWIAGGGEVYRQTMNLADELHISHFDVRADGDTFFPDIDEDVWRVDSQQAGRSDPAHVYKIYKRIAPTR